MKDQLADPPRRFARSINNAILCYAAAVQFSCVIQAADIYVDANADGAGDGTIVRPYWRITDAVVRARNDRARSLTPVGERITIHVAAGTYHGTYDAQRLAAQPQMEVLPIVLNTPNLTLSGATLLDLDARGLPARVRPAPETILTTSDSQLFDTGHNLILITRTSDGGVGDGVTVTGFDLKQKQGGSAEAITTGGIFVDRVSRFAIRGNGFAHTPFGLGTRLASGAVDGNLFNCYGYGAVLSGGSIAQPAVVTVSGNRSTSHVAGGMILNGVAEMRPLDMGANPLCIQPLQTVYDRSNRHDRENIPDTLDVLVLGNDFSDNPHFGLRLFAYSPYIYTTKDGTQPLTSVLNATITGNTLLRNGDYGIVADAGFSNRDRLSTRTLTTLFTGTFADNLYLGNGRTSALFTFNNFWVSVGLDDPQALGYLSFSRYQITDANADLAGFDYDNPITDPLDGTALTNTLILNGASIPPLTKITPLKP